MFFLKVCIQIIMVLASLFLIFLILLHKGQGGGLSDLFGGGLSSGSGGSGVAERNLDIITVIVTIVWVACILALLLMTRFGVI